MTDDRSSNGTDEYIEPDPQRHSRVLRGTAALPSLVTLGNGIAGFAAIHFATKPLPPTVIAQGEAAAETWVAHNLVIAAWLLLAGMVCDAVDGQLARMTRRTSDFGAQLDSLCDAISFGVAPAIIALRTFQSVLFPIVGEVDVLARTALAGRVVWFIAALYACCAILRLARFNVETDPDPDSHMVFKGLPSPAAATSIIALVLLHAHLLKITEGWLAAEWLPAMVVWAIPVLLLAAALLMVSRLEYPHLVNQYFRGRRSFGYIVRLTVLVLAVVILDTEFTLAVIILAYVLYTPIRSLVRRIRLRSKRASKA